MEQLKEMLKEVLQEELRVVLKQEIAPITDRLDGLENRMISMEGQVTSIEGQVTSMEGQMALISVQLDRMERAQAEDVVAVLQVIDKKITARTDRHDHQINVLNDRLLAVEADVHKLLTT